MIVVPYIGNAQEIQSLSGMSTSPTTSSSNSSSTHALSTPLQTTNPTKTQTQIEPITRPTLPESTSQDQTLRIKTPAKPISPYDH